MYRNGSVRVGLYSSEAISGTGGEEVLHNIVCREMPLSSHFHHRK